MDVLIVGAGQAGLSLSYCLTRDGIQHLILERAQVAESWRNARWSSFCLVTPNWAINLAGRPYRGPEPGGFMPRDDLVEYLESYAASFDAPVRAPCTVVRVEPIAAAGLLAVETDTGDVYNAKAVVVATATHREAHFPECAASLPASVMSLHASDYRKPDALPPGAVMVVGSAQSGCQIADELNRAERDVVLATGATGRLPRRYRGRDIIEWQQLMGFLDRPASALETPAHRFRPDPHLTGQGGGRTLDLRALSRAGVKLVGRVLGFDDQHARFAADSLADNLAFADTFADNILAGVDAYIESAAIDAPIANPDNSDLGYNGERFVPDSPAALDLVAERIRAVVWATGFRHDFSWVRAPVFDAFGYPIQTDGCTTVPGLHFLGLNYVERRGSGILYGIGGDAEQLGEAIRVRLSAE